MRNEKQIVAELKDYINRSKPFRFYTPVMALLNELDSKFPFEEETIVVEPVVEEVVEETVAEEIIEEVIEKPIEEPVVAKKSTKKK